MISMSRAARLALARFTFTVTTGGFLDVFIGKQRSVSGTVSSAALPLGHIGLSLSAMYERKTWFMRV
jgi:hypothetical protein